MSDVEFRADERGGVTVMRDGHPQSYVALDDPELLVFEYVQHLALALELLPAGPVAATHIGGAGLSLARYLNHVRPGSPQIVLEPDAALTDAVRRELPLPRGHRIRVRPVDGASGLQTLRDATADVIVVDAFDHGRVPVDLVLDTTTAGYARVLRPSGVLLLNVTDNSRKKFLDAVLATLARHFDDQMVVTTTEVLKRGRFGNYVVIASRTPLDDGLLRRRVASLPFPTTLLDRGTVAARARHARPIRSADQISPPPPDPGNFRLR